MKWFTPSHEPTDGEARALAQPQALPAGQWWEAQATHEVWSEADGGWVPAVVEEIAGRAFVVPAMRVYGEDQGE